MTGTGPDSLKLRENGQERSHVIGEDTQLPCRVRAGIVPHTAENGQERSHLIAPLSVLGLVSDY